MMFQAPLYLFLTIISTLEGKKVPFFLSKAQKLNVKPPQVSCCLKHYKVRLTGNTTRICLNVIKKAYMKAGQEEVQNAQKSIL